MYQADNPLTGVTDLQRNLAVLAVPVAVNSGAWSISWPGPVLATSCVLIVAWCLVVGRLGPTEIGWPAIADLRLARDLLPRRRQGVVHDAGGRVAVGPGQPQTVLTSSTVIKQQSVEIAGIEYVKTRRAAVIAARSNLFDVPAIHDFDRDGGRIVFERFDDVVPLWTWLCRRRPEPATRMARMAGTDLAAIHESLWLPPDLGVTQPQIL